MNSRNPICLLLCVSFLAFSVLSSQAQTAPIVSLSQGQAIVKETNETQIHLYQLSLQSEHLVAVEVDQRGIDLVIKVIAPNGKEILEVDGPHGNKGIEKIEFITNESGDFKLEIRALEKKPAQGSYEIKFVELRTATQQDKIILAAKTKYDEASALYGGTGETGRKQAIAKLEESLALWREAGDRKGETKTLYSIGLVYRAINEIDKASEFYQKAYNLSLNINDKLYQAMALQGIAGIQQSKGDFQKAFESYLTALEIVKELNDRAGQASILNTLANLYLRAGDKQNYFLYAEQSLAIWRELNDVYGITNLLTNISVAYRSLGNTQKVIELLEEGVAVQRKHGDKTGKATMIGNLGVAYLQAGEKQKALESFKESLALYEEAKIVLGIANTKLKLGDFYQETGDIQTALSYYEEALKIYRQIGTRRDIEATALNKIGSLYKQIGDYQKALEHYRNAQVICRDISGFNQESYVLLNIAKVENARGNLVDAHKAIESAIEIVESQRAGFISQEQRALFRQSKQEFYDFYINLLMGLHAQQPQGSYNAIAFEANERYIARSTIDSLIESKADIREGIEPSLLERERKLQTELKNKSDALMKLAGRKPTKEQEQAARKEFDSLLADYQQLQSQIRSTSPRYAALTQPASLSLSDIQQQVLDKDSVLIEYALGKEKSFVWVVTNNSIDSYELAKRAEIETAARRVYELLTARTKQVKFETIDEKQERVEKADADFYKAVSSLSKTILAPFADKLNKKRLLIVADGALQYVPFSALSTKTQYEPLIAGYEIVNLPSASALSVMRQQLNGRKPAPNAVAVLADPVFGPDDQRMKPYLSKIAKDQKSNFAANHKSPFALGFELSRFIRETESSDKEISLSRLPFTRKEALAISAQVAQTERKIAMDFSANREVLNSPEISKYKIVHFATHGFFNSANPELSGIVLSLVDQNGERKDGFLLARDIYNLKLPAELIVLSGCRTGLGKEIRGEGLVGLTRGFMYAGAARVAVSLWDVHDEATAELMTRFYRGMLKEKLSPSAALRQAQVSMMKDSRWSSPYYWASFVLQGEPN
jgi:CHAT domain-containing protein/Tfp pilus assembly protein PilF